VANYLRNLAGLEPDDTADDMKARNVDE
jgi:hypothetical protein